jgi:glutamate-1-semialdehyde 2,1-aminomutase
MPGVGEQSRDAFAKIKGIIPGGLDGNAKYFDAMPVIKRAYGCRVLDVDDREYIDYCCGYGPLVFGHDDPDMTEALANNIRTGGMVYGLPHLLMEEAASLVSRCFKCAEMVRFTNSGTEATLSCIRVARATTGRDKIVKFYGAYHGTHESVLIGTKVTEAEPSYPYVGQNSAGLPQGVLQDTYVLPFNDVTFVGKFIDEHAGEIAAVLVEPVLGSYGVVGERSFFETLRSLTARNGILLIFDEVVTGFRLALGGMQELYGVTADLVALGKGMGGGFPIGAFAGLGKYMEKVAPTGNTGFDNLNVVYHSGTYNSNPMAMTAVRTALTKLMNPVVLQTMNASGQRLREGLQSLMKKYGVRGTTTGMGSLVQWFFGIEGKVTRPEELVRADKKLQARFHSLLLQEGIFFIPGPRGYVSYAHGPSDLDQTLEALERAFKRL